jgi:hypothetical protein
MLKKKKGVKMRKLQVMKSDLKFLLIDLSELLLLLSHFLGYFFQNAYWALHSQEVQTYLVFYCDGACKAECVYVNLRTFGTF